MINDFNWNNITDNKEEYKRFILEFINNDIYFNIKKVSKVSLSYIDSLNTTIEVKIYCEKELQTFTYQPLNNHRIEKKD